MRHLLIIITPKPIRGQEIDNQTVVLAALTIVESLDTGNKYLKSWRANNASSFTYKSNSSIAPASYHSLAQLLIIDVLSSLITYPVALVVSILLAVTTFKTIQWAVDGTHSDTPKSVGLVSLPILQDAATHVGVIAEAVQKGETLEVLAHWTRMARRDLLGLAVWGMLVARWRGVVCVPEVGLGFERALGGDDGTCWTADGGRIVEPRGWCCHDWSVCGCSGLCLVVRT